MSVYGEPPPGPLVRCPSCGVTLVQDTGEACGVCRRPTPPPELRRRDERRDRDGRLFIPHAPPREDMAVFRRVRAGEGRRWR